MDISKVKFELYDVLAVLVPGFLFICSCWIFLKGWPSFVSAFLSLPPTGFTALLFIAFPVGHLIQECGDTAIKKARGERYFKAARDSFWDHEDGKSVRRAIHAQLGFEPTVDTAFDFCLSKVKDIFPRRDSFLATSDFARSLFVLGILSIPALVRMLVEAEINGVRKVIYGVATTVVWTAFLFLSQRRMSRFRALAETTVFKAYLATNDGSKVVKLADAGEE